MQQQQPQYGQSQYAQVQVISLFHLDAFFLVLPLPPHQRNGPLMPCSIRQCGKITSAYMYASRLVCCMCGPLILFTLQWYERVMRVSARVMRAETENCVVLQLHSALELDDQ